MAPSGEWDWKLPLHHITRQTPRHVQMTGRTMLHNWSTGHLCMLGSLRPFQKLNWLKVSHLECDPHQKLIITRAVCARSGCCECCTQIDERHFDWDISLTRNDNRQTHKHNPVHNQLCGWQMIYNNRMWSTTHLYLHNTPVLVQHTCICTIHLYLHNTPVLVQHTCICTTHLY